MTIVHVLQDIRKTDGISEFVRNLLVQQCAQENCSCYFLHQEHGVFEGEWNQRIPVFESNGTLDCLGFMPDVVHVHGVWSLFSVRAMAWCRKYGVKYIVSPHGGLMQRVLNKGRVKKRCFYWLLLRRCLNKAAAIHCTGEGERDAVANLKLRVSSFCVPLGCKLPIWPIERNWSNCKEILFLSRISEEKGLLVLLEAWKNIEHNGWRLILAGPSWRGYREKLEKIATAEKITDVSFAGPADSMKKDELYRSAALFVLPSPMENFSLVVLDALAYGLPVICTKGTPWKCIAENGCGWWIDSNSSYALSSALKEAFGRHPVDFPEMGGKARELAEKFSWANVSRMLLQAYHKELSTAIK